MAAAGNDRAGSGLRARSALAAVALACVSPCWSAGTPAGTPIDNVATVSYELAGTTGMLDSNTVTFRVLERLDVAVTLQSGQVPVSANQSGASLLFTLTNTGNGDEQFRLAIDSAIPGDDFDPLPAVPAIYFDSDASGTLSAGDVAYQPALNDPQLAADQSVDLLLVNNIPAALTDGMLGNSTLLAVSATGSGVPGESVAGAGSGGVDAVFGASGGTVATVGAYVVADADVRITKSVATINPAGGTAPVTGATLVYTLAVEVINSGTATGAVITDPVPANTSFVANSILLNGGSVTDAMDMDAGELATGGQAMVVVRLGDLSQADGVQLVEFRVTID